MSKPEEQGSIGVLEVLIIFGYTAFFAWYYLIIIGYPSFFPADSDMLVKRIVQLMSFVGTFAGSVFALWKPKDYEKSAYDPRKTVGWAIVSCIIPIFVMIGAVGVSLPVPLICVVMLATGFGAGYYMTGWENLASRGRLTDALVSIGMIMVIALALFLVVNLFMMPLARGVMGVVFGLVGSVLFYGVSKRRDKPAASGKQKKASKAAAKEAEEEAKEDAEEESFKGTFNLKLDTLLLFTNIPLGFGLAVLYLFESMYFYIAIGVALITLVLFIVFVRSFKLDLTFINLLRISIGAIVVALVALGIAHELSLLCSIILFAIWLVLRVAHAVIILKLTKVQKVPPVYLARTAK